LTPNGKVDRKALPKPEVEKLTEKHYVAPETELERAITAIWQQVLKLEKVGIHDNFFEVGGHSLLMAQVLNKVRELSGKDISMMALFQNPTIASLCKYLGGEQIEQSSFQQAYVRTKMQEKTIVRQKELRKVRRRS
jgi:aryl carrier-like protein